MLKAFLSCFYNSLSLPFPHKNNQDEVFYDISQLVGNKYLNAASSVSTEEI